MTKAKMIRRIRSMQREMGCPPCSAKTLRAEYSYDEVAAMHASTCETYSAWLNRQALQ